MSLFWGNSVQFTGIFGRDPSPMYSTVWRSSHGVRKSFSSATGTMHIFSGDLVQMVLVPRFPIQAF